MCKRVGALCLFAVVLIACSGLNRVSAKPDQEGIQVQDKIDAPTVIQLEHAGHHVHCRHGRHEPAVRDRKSG